MNALDAADLLTVRYAGQLPLVLASFPRLSSQLAQTRPAPTSTGGTGAKDPRHCTCCSYCGAETIGGVSGSYWVENGRLVGHCSGCRRSTLRRERVHASHTTTTTANEGKVAFERVKKRRRRAAPTLDYRREIQDEILHPTALLLANRRAAGSLPSSKVSSRAHSHSETPGPSPSSTRAETAPRVGTIRPGSTSATNTSSGSLSKRSNPDGAAAPIDSARASPLLGSSGLFSRASSVRPPTLNAASSRPPSRTESPAVPPGSMSASPSPGPRTGSESSTSSAIAAATTATATKKRKRPKQPSGLAGLLAQKKERELASTSAAKGAGGLMDFLQEL
ncbi:hypothetical protein BMF94_7033 [Rhodotorula taiwanensis]|uniref:Uncharacterized protein n=1 Tax=Rhodotorula taiwanensis TaxID=741276 RepID=A0A2S5AZN3_9BASI|nr:hypothetical protein BMF94_7033 [Rhodotorula taiwanensis]